MSVGEALACSAVSASHSASGAFVRNFAEGRVWFGAASPLGEVRSYGVGESMLGRVVVVGGGLRRQGNEDEGTSWPSLPLRRLRAFRR